MTASEVFVWALAIGVGIGFLLGIAFHAWTDRPLDPLPDDPPPPFPPRPPLPAPDWTVRVPELEVKR
jgi:hypothetical protein